MRSGVRPGVTFPIVSCGCKPYYYAAVVDGNMLMARTPAYDSEDDDGVIREMSLR